MAQLESIIAQIAAMLSITSLDVYVFFGLLVMIVIIAILGLARIYSVLFGTVLGIGIFVLFSTVLSPEYQTPETLSLISDTFAKAIIGSSVYLIFILTILVPMSGGISVTLPKTVLGKIFQTISLTFLLILFLTAVFLGLIEKSYIFIHTESFFTYIKKLSIYSELQSSLLFTFVSAHLPTIIIMSIGFIIYKILFADIVNSMVTSLIEQLKKQRNTGAGGYEEVPSHDVEWHEEFEEDHWWHEESDPHGWHGHH